MSSNIRLAEVVPDEPRGIERFDQRLAQPFIYKSVSEETRAA